MRVAARSCRKASFMKRLVTSTNSAEVELARSILETAGIRFEVRQETVAQVFPSTPFEPELWVDDADYDEAARLLRGNDEKAAS